MDMLVRLAKAISTLSFIHLVSFLIVDFLTFRSVILRYFDGIYFDEGIYFDDGVNFEGVNYFDGILQ